MTVPLYLIFGFIGFLILAVIVIVSMGKLCINEKKRSMTLERCVEEQKRNVAYLVRHAEELAEINRDKTSTKQKIQEAKSDEEISDIVSAIIDANNKRVQDATTK